MTRTRPRTSRDRSLPPLQLEQREERRQPPPHLHTLLLGQRKQALHTRGAERTAALHERRRGRHPAVQPHEEVVQATRAVVPRGVVHEHLLYPALARPSQATLGERLGARHGRAQDAQDARVALVREHREREDATPEVRVAERVAHVGLGVLARPPDAVAQAQDVVRQAAQVECEGEQEGLLDEPHDVDRRDRVLEVERDPALLLAQVPALLPGRGGVQPVPRPAGEEEALQAARGGLEDAVGLVLVGDPDDGCEGCEWHGLLH